MLYFTKHFGKYCCILYIKNWRKLIQLTINYILIARYRTQNYKSLRHYNTITLSVGSLVTKFILVLMVAHGHQTGCLQVFVIVVLVES